MSLTGDKLVALSTLSISQVTNGTTVSGAYVSTLTGGVACGLSFIAPATGRVIIHHATEMNNAGGYCLVTVRVRTGLTIGSGADVLAASDDNSIFHNTNIRLGVAVPLENLVPGSPYNVQQLYRVSAGTGTLGKKTLILEPQP